MSALSSATTARTARRRRSRRRSASPPTVGDRIVVGFGYEPGGYGEEHAAHREEVRKFGERITAAALARDRRGGRSRRAVELVAERPVDALISLAESHDARAIVVGTHGEHPAKAAFLGSTPHRLLHVSSRPVLVVPVPDEARAGSLGWRR